MKLLTNLIESEEVEIALEETGRNRNCDIPSALDTSGNDLIVVVYILFEFSPAVFVKVDSGVILEGSLFVNVPRAAGICCQKDVISVGPVYDIPMHPDSGFCPVR